MKRLLVCVVLLTATSCAPPYVWGSEERVRQQLLDMVPAGSSRRVLAEVAARRGWEIDRRNIQTWPGGTKTYLESRNIRECRSHGGAVVPAIIAHYSAPFETYVESLWLFDTQQHLADVCVRKSSDAV